MRLKKWITNNFGLKIATLILAVVTWVYVSLELAKIKSEEEKSIINMLQYEVVSKRLPVQLTLVGQARGDRQVATEGITIEPEAIVVIGPDNILKDVAFVRTVPIDISEYTQDIVKDVDLAPIKEGIALKHTTVRVRIPIAVKAGDKPSE